MSRILVARALKRMRFDVSDASMMGVWPGLFVLLRASFL